MSATVELIEDHLQLEGKSGLIDFALQFVSERFDQLFREVPGFLVLPHSIFIQTLCFVMNILHLPIEEIQFVVDVGWLVLDGKLFRHYLAVELFVDFEGVH